MNKTKKAIFDASIKEFSMSGYNGTTVDEIAMNAGVAKGTLYYHFKSKEEIFAFVINEGINILEQEIKSVEKDDNPIEILKKICETQLKFLYRNKDFFKVLISHMWGQEIRNSNIRDKIEVYLRGIETHVKAAMEQGLIKQGNSTVMAYLFFGSLCSAAVYEVMNVEDIQLEQIEKNLIDFTLRGMGANLE